MNSNNKLAANSPRFLDCTFSSPLPSATGAASNASVETKDRRPVPENVAKALMKMRAWADDDDQPCYMLSTVHRNGMSSPALKISREFYIKAFRQPYFFIGFSFSKGKEYINDADKFVYSVSGQLSVWPSLQLQVAKAKMGTSEISNEDLQCLWHTLIVGPLIEAHSSRPGRDGDIAHLIHLLLRAQDLPKTRLRAFVSSQREMTVEDGVVLDLGTRMPEARGCWNIIKVWD